MSHGKALSRGDRRRNERLARLRLIVRRDFAVVAVDLASAKQATVVTDHDSMVLGRHMFTGDAWVIDDILDWAEPIAAKAGYAGVVLGCEPTGHRWKPLLDRSRARGLELVCVNPMLVHRGREEEDFTRDRLDFKDATIIAKRVAELRCYVPYVMEGNWCRLGGIWVLAAPTSSSLWDQRGSGCVTFSNVLGLQLFRQRVIRWMRSPGGRPWPCRPIPAVSWEPVTNFV